jgi:hypothetical protein
MSSLQNNDAGASYVRLTKGDPSNSLISILSGQRNPIGEDPTPAVQMPPLVTHVVDTQGHALLDVWITAIPP